MAVQIELCKDNPKIVDPDTACWNSTEIKEWIDNNKPGVRMLYSFSFVDFKNATDPFQQTIKMTDRVALTMREANKAFVKLDVV